MGILFLQILILFFIHSSCWGLLDASGVKAAPSPEGFQGYL